MYASAVATPKEELTASIYNPSPKYKTACSNNLLLFLLYLCMHMFSMRFLQLNQDIRKVFQIWQEVNPRKDIIKRCKVCYRALHLRIPAALFPPHSLFILLPLLHKPFFHAGRRTPQNKFPESLPTPAFPLRSGTSAEHLSK